MTVSETTLDMLAAAIHESDPRVLPWDKLPASPANPQRARALRAASAVVALFSPGRAAIEDVATALGGELGDFEELKSNFDTAAMHKMVTGQDPERCDKCGHAAHGPVCFNMASDNGCDCRYADVRWS